MGSESKAAFYKATKFWILFVIALVVAAVLWRMWEGDTSFEDPAPPAVTQVELPAEPAAALPADDDVPPYDPEADDEELPQLWCGTGGTSGLGSDVVWDATSKGVWALIRALKDHADFYVRLACVTELERRGATEAIPALERAAKGDEDDLVRGAAKIAVASLRRK